MYINSENVHGYKKKIVSLMKKQNNLTNANSKTTPIFGFD